MPTPFDRTDELRRLTRVEKQLKRLRLAVFGEGGSGGGSVPPLSWIGLATGVAAAGGEPAYAIDQQGMVHLRGGISVAPGSALGIGLGGAPPPPFDQFMPAIAWKMEANGLGGEWPQGAQMPVVVWVLVGGGVLVVASSGGTGWDDHSIQIDGLSYPGPDAG